MHSSIIFFLSRNWNTPYREEMHPKIIPITGSHMVKYTEISETMIIEIKCFLLFLFYVM